MRPFLLLGLVAWVGAALLLSELRWFSRAPLTERLRPYSPGGMGRAGRAGVLSVESFREAVGPLSRSVGERISRIAESTDHDYYPIRPGGRVALPGEPGYDADADLALPNDGAG